MLPVLTYTAPARGRATHCAGATGRSSSRASGRSQLGLAAPPSRGGRSTGRSARATGRRGRPPSTSTPTSPTPSSATRRPPRTRQFDRDVGVELLVETARLWRSLGHHDAAGTFRIDGVTGPDEYSAIADNNVYTNLMAQRNLAGRADAVERHPDVARTRSASTTRRPPRGATPPRRCCIPYDDELGVHPQAEGFTTHEVLGLRSDRARPVPAAAALPVLRPVPQAGRQAGRPRARDAPVRRRASPTSRRLATSPTTSG